MNGTDAQQQSRSINDWPQDGATRQPTQRCFVLDAWLEKCCDVGDQVDGAEVMSRKDSTPFFLTIHPWIYLIGAAIHILVVMKERRCGV